MCFCKVCMFVCPYGRGFSAYIFRGSQTMIMDERDSVLIQSGRFSAKLIIL